MLLGFLGGWLLTRQRVRFYSVDQRKIDTLALILPISGLFGARLFARLFYAKLPLLEALKIWEGDGLVFYGGFIFSIAAILIFGAVRRMNLLALCDCLAPALALGLTFGRVGCFLGGCCWGDVCASRDVLAKVDPLTARQVQTMAFISNPEWPLAVCFPRGSDPYKQQAKLGLIDRRASASLPVHPVQLYEAAMAAVLCLFLHRRFRGNHLPGSAAVAVLSGYAIIRFFTEYLRADNKLYAFGLTFSQLFSLEILVFCLLALGIRRLNLRPALENPSSAAIAEDALH